MDNQRQAKIHIDSYQFGRIVIDGKAYDKDCLIVGDRVHANWWRKQGHVFAVEDLQIILEAKPAVLVVGCGSPGLMKVSEDAQRTIREKGIELIALDSHKAANKYNELAGKAENVAAAFHLTC